MLLQSKNPSENTCQYIVWVASIVAVGPRSLNCVRRRECEVTATNIIPQFSDQQVPSPHFLLYNYTVYFFRFHVVASLEGRPSSGRNGERVLDSTVSSVSAINACHVKSSTGQKYIDSIS